MPSPQALRYAPPRATGRGAGADRAVDGPHRTRRVERDGRPPAGRPRRRRRVRAGHGHPRRARAGRAAAGVGGGAPGGHGRRRWPAGSCASSRSRGSSPAAPTGPTAGRWSWRSPPKGRDAYRRLRAASVAAAGDALAGWKASELAELARTARPHGRRLRRGPPVTEQVSRVAVVTGVGPGIGRSTALALAREGCDVVVAARARRLPRRGGAGARSARRPRAGGADRHR